MIQRRRSLAMACALFGAVLPTTTALAKMRVLEGTVSYRERIALPPSAMFDVRLVDVSRADAPAVERVGQQADAGPATPAGRWLAEDIGGRGVIDNLQSVLEIAPDGAVSGRGGCNGMGGRAIIAAGSIRFSQIVSTQMACAPAAMDQEGKFFAALRAARSWRIDTARNKLFLLDGKGRPVIVLARM